MRGFTSTGKPLLGTEGSGKLFGTLVNTSSTTTTNTTRETANPFDTSTDYNNELPAQVPWTSDETQFVSSFATTTGEQIPYTTGQEMIDTIFKSRYEHEQRVVDRSVDWLEAEWTQSDKNALNTLSRIESETRASASTERPLSGVPFPGGHFLSQTISAFNSAEDAFKNYHMVRGKKRYGFIVDPGASSGLMGTDTLLEYQLGIMSKWWLPNLFMTDSNTQLSGISGEADGAVKKCWLPFWTPECGTSRWECDLIGGTGSDAQACLRCLRSSGLLPAC